MFKAIKRWLFGEPFVDEICKGIVKDKKLSPEQKIETILNNYQQYFLNKFHQDVNMATYEMHYEQFMDKNNQRNEGKYKLCYSEEKNNMAFCQIAMLSTFYKDIKAQGLDKQKLSFQQNRMLLILETFDKEFAKLGYDGTRFYSDFEVQANLLKITYRAIDCIKDIQAEAQNNHDSNQQTSDQGAEL